MGQKAFKRVERKRSIMTAFAVMVTKSQSPRLTVAGIARKIGLEPSTHLRKIVAELVEEGTLIAELQDHRPGWQKVVYSLPPTSSWRPVPRLVKLNVGGKAVGQLELFN